MSHNHEVAVKEHEKDRDDSSKVVWSTHSSSSRFVRRADGTVIDESNTHTRNSEGVERDQVTKRNNKKEYKYTREKKGDKVTEYRNMEGKELESFEQDWENACGKVGWQPIDLSHIDEPALEDKKA